MQQSQQQKAAHLHSNKSKIAHTTVLTTSISTPTTVTINITNQNMKTKDRTILSAPGGLPSTNVAPPVTQNKQHPMHKIPSHSMKNEFSHDFNAASLKQAAMLQPQLVSNPKGFQDGLMSKGDRTKYSIQSDNKNLQRNDGNDPMIGAQKFKQYPQQYHVPQLDKKSRPSPHIQGDYEALKPTPKASVFDNNNKKIFDNINHVMNPPPKQIPILPEDNKRVPSKKPEDLDKKVSTASVQDTKAKTSTLSSEVSDNSGLSKTSPAKDIAKKGDIPAPVKPANKSLAGLQGPQSFAKVVENKVPMENLKKSENNDSKSTNKSKSLTDKNSGDEKGCKIESNTDKDIGGDIRPENLETQNKYNKPNLNSNDNKNININSSSNNSADDKNSTDKNNDEDKNKYKDVDIDSNKDKENEKDLKETEKINEDNSKQTSKEEKTNLNQKRVGANKNTESSDFEKVTGSIVDSVAKGKDTDKYEENRKDSDKDKENVKDKEKDTNTDQGNDNRKEKEQEKNKEKSAKDKDEGKLEDKVEGTAKDGGVEFKLEKDEKDGDNKLKKKNNGENDKVSHNSNEARSGSPGSIQPTPSSSRQENDVSQGSVNVSDSEHGSVSENDKNRNEDNRNNDNNQNNNTNNDNNINYNNNNADNNENNNNENFYGDEGLIIIDDNNNNIGNINNNIDDNNNNIGNNNYNIDDNNNNIGNVDNNNNINVMNNNNINNNNNENNPENVDRNNVIAENNENNINNADNVNNENNPDNHNSNENVNINPESSINNQGDNNNENADIISDGARRSDSDKPVENSENAGDESTKNVGIDVEDNLNVDSDSLASKTLDSLTSKQEEEDEQGEEDEDSTNTAVSTSVADSSAQPVRSAKPLLLNYEEGQWSPENADGKKCYNRDQLITLRDAVASQTTPKIEDNFQLIVKKQPNNFCMPNFASNTKNQSASLASRSQFAKRSPAQPGMQQSQQGGSGSGKGSKSGMIHVSLSLREDVKLNESANAWKPAFLTGAIQTTDSNNIDALCKRVRGILNKLTPEKFEPLLEQIQALNIDTSEKLSSVISLVFEKAIDEPNFSAAYAMLCRKLSKPIEEKEEKERKEREENAGNDKKTAEKKEGSTQAIFKKELLNKCQQEFNNHVANENSIQTKLTPIQNEINETNDSTRKLELKASLEEEERKLRRRSVGTVRFIGELYRQNMLTTNIMDWCIIALLKIRTEEKLECLCKLLTTVGRKMEEKMSDEVQNQKHYRDLTPHFQTMQSIASDNKKHPKISSRVRFMLMDVIELRKNKWVPRRNDVNPKTMVQIQKEAEQEQYKNELLNMSMGGNSGNLSGGMGGNNSRGKDGRDRNDRGMRNDPRGGSLMGSGYNMGGGSGTGNKNMRGGYQDTEGWIQQGSNKNRGGSSTNTMVDTSKFKGRTVSLNLLYLFLFISILLIIYFLLAFDQNIDDNTSLGAANQFKWNQHLSKASATTSLTNSFSVLEPETYKSIPSSNNRSRELYQSKGSMERARYGNKISINSFRYFIDITYFIFYRWSRFT